jgi:preprotein translocase subunit SecG
MRITLWTAGAFIVLCIVLAVATTSVVGTVISIMFGGTAFVLLIAAAFLAVGQSEDREREREAAERADAQRLS